MVLQGSDGGTVKHQISQLASVSISDRKVYPKKFLRTDTVHCKWCGSKRDPALMLLCDVCNDGTFYVYPPLEDVSNEGWMCAFYKVVL